MAVDPISEFKSTQRETWSSGNFSDMAVFTTPVAGHLIRFAGVESGQMVLDVATGTGVVAITARRTGARVTGLDLTPFMLAQAKDNAELAGFDDITWEEDDVEALPFADGTFDIVLSQFGHIFAPRPDVAIAEMLRVLKRGGVIAFASWPPEQLVGRLFALNSKYVPPLNGLAKPSQWGDVSIVQQRLGSRVRDLFFERGTMAIPALSPQHLRALREAKAGPFVRTVQALSHDPARLASWRAEIDELSRHYIRDNVAYHECLLTRAIKT